LQKMTACVMVSVSYRSHSVSNFHSSFSTATKNCLMPCARRYPTPCHTLPAFLQGTRWNPPATLSHTLRLSSYYRALSVGLLS
jgi:hypothetical protein